MTYFKAKVKHYIKKKLKKKILYNIFIFNDIFFGIARHALKIIWYWVRFGFLVSIEYRV